jgi:hypothetical protein
LPYFDISTVVAAESLCRRLGGDGTSNKNSNNQNDDNNQLRSIGSGVKAYPNPSQDKWNIVVGDKQATGIHAELYNTTGIKVWERQNINGKFSIDNAAFPAGLYYLRMTINGKPNCLKLSK